MAIKRRIKYLQRVFSAYFLDKSSQLSFWHDCPEENNSAFHKNLGEYYMLFSQKAGYRGPFDGKGIPLLDYKGIIGRQYNPIAISQYALANYNIFKKKNTSNFNIFIKQADWLVDNLEINSNGLKVWMHHFDWEYKAILKNPWYSALAQGQAISVLCRAFLETKNEKYSAAADSAFLAFLKSITGGGVYFEDDKKNIWLEEYIVSPPTHILNGFIWALWGVRDYFLLTSDAKANDLYEKCLKTLKNNLAQYDAGFWSLYDLSGLRMKNFASPFYHKLHIVQLNVLYSLTGDEFFKKYSEKWDNYQKNIFFKTAALFYKAIFKIFYF